MFLVYFDRELLRINTAYCEETTGEVFSTPEHQCPVQLTGGVSSIECLKCSYCNVYSVWLVELLLLLYNHHFPLSHSEDARRAAWHKERKASSEEELFRESFRLETRGTEKISLLYNRAPCFNHQKEMLLRMSPSGPFLGFVTAPGLHLCELRCLEGPC